MFVLKVTGTGTLFFHAYGDIHPVDVDGEYVVDNGYAVAWEPSLSYTLTRGKEFDRSYFPTSYCCDFRVADGSGFSRAVRER